MLPEIELKKFHLNKAFSITELAVVITIIGLLAMMVTVGKGLKEDAQIRGIYTEFRTFDMAKDQFFEKYGYLPGDFPFSDKFFGTSCDATATNCNGNGNGLVNFISGSDTSNAAGYAEPLLFWRHLGISGFIKGSYIGKVQGTVGGLACGSYFRCCFRDGPNKGCPGSSYKDGIYLFTSFFAGTGGVEECSAVSDSYYPRNTDRIILGRFRGNNPPYNALFTTLIAYKFDSKFDDGIPTKGILQARTGNDVASGSDYCLANSSNVKQNNFDVYGKDYKYKLDSLGDKCVMQYLPKTNSLCANTI